MGSKCTLVAAASTSEAAGPGRCFTRLPLSPASTCLRAEAILKKEQGDIKVIENLLGLDMELAAFILF